MIKLIIRKYNNILQKHEQMKEKFKTPSKASPRAGSKRGCLCEDGTYSTKCCDGSLQAQGIGKTAEVNEPAPTQTENNGVRTIIRQNG
jgi:hypothetical protein